MEIGVVGNDDFVTGFSLAGVRNIFTVKEDKKRNDLVEKIVNEDKIGILIMEESDFSRLSNMIKKKLDRVVAPVVVTLSKEGKEENLRELVKRSVGVDLWK